MAAPGHSKKAHFHVPEQSSTIPQIPSKSHSNFLCKSVIIVLIILVIPLFPSQAPDFITESFLNQFWEIFHFLFIGIAVSYGLFSRKTAQTVTEKTVHCSTNDASNEYLSEISQLSSIFEDGFESFSGTDEQDVLQRYGNFQYMQSSNAEFLGKDRKSVVEKSKKIGSFVSKDGIEGVGESDGKRMTQVRRSEWLKGESFVVVSNGKDFLDKSNEIKPLNLPVRSLRSRIVDNDRPESRKRRERSPKFEIKGNDDVEVVKIRGVVPKTLEKKFEGVVGPSTIPWRSRSGRMEMGGEQNTLKPPAHSRRQSVGEFEFKHLRSKSFIDSMNSISPSLKPPAHSTRQSVGEFEFEHLKSKSFIDSTNSTSPELRSSEVENWESEKDIGEPVISVSHPKVGPLDADASFNGAKPRSRSFGASAEMNVPRNFDFELGKSCDFEEEDKIGKGKQAIESLESDMRSPTLAKVLSKAKSVRTIKPSRYIVGEKNQYSGEVEADSLVKIGKGGEPEDSSVNHQSQLYESIFSLPKPKPKPSLPEMHNEEKESIDYGKITESEEDIKSEFDKSSDEDEVEPYIDSDAELEGSEVDRKAGEFIAKFREQIRLQRFHQQEDTVIGSMKVYDMGVAAKNF